MLLSALEEAPAHGYALARGIERRSKGALKLAEGSLYPALHDLELEKLIEPKWVTSPEGRKRRVYSITRKGRREIRSWQASWEKTVALLRLVVRSPGTA